MNQSKRRGSLEDDESDDEPQHSRYNTSSITNTKVTNNSLDTVQNTANTSLIHIINMEGRINKLEKDINDMRKDIKQILMLLKTISIASNSSGLVMGDTRKMNN